MSRAPNLKDRVLDQGDRIYVQSEQCGLKKPGCACRGTGIRVFAEGAFGRCELCSCVQKCRRCRGTGRAIDGKTSKPCKQPEPPRLVGMYNAMEIPSKYANASLGEFRNFSGNGRAVMTQVQSWLSTAGTRNQRSLIVSGPVGVGKTFLLAGAAIELVMRGLSVKFVDFFALLGTLRSAYSAGGSDREILGPLLDVDVLVLDELGKGRNSEWEQTILDSLVMVRYNAGKPIVASTNYPLFSDLKPQQSYHVDLEASRGSSFNPDVFEPLENRIGKRIYSRLVEMSIFVELTGEDFRRVGRRGPGDSFSPLR